jgi:hypothetical protein
MTVTTTPIILGTPVSFADPDAALTDLGWRRHGTTAAPVLGGEAEPELTERIRTEMGL